MDLLCECGGDRHQLNITREEYDYGESLHKPITFICNSDCAKAIKEVQSGRYIKIFDNGKYMVQIHKRDASRTLVQYFLDWCDKTLTSN